MQSAQFENENEKDDYRHKFTAKEEKRKKSKEKPEQRRKKHFSPQMKLNCVCFIIAFYVFIVMKTYVPFYLGTFSFIMRGENISDLTKFSIYDKKYIMGR